MRENSPLKDPIDWKDPFTFLPTQLTPCALTAAWGLTSRCHGNDFGATLIAKQTLTTASRRS